MIAQGGYVYIMSNSLRTVLYIGVTSDLMERVWNHKYADGSTFTKRYNCKDLIYYEFFDSIESAIERETQLKRWKREWKEDLIKKFNPQLKDLYLSLEGMN